MLHKINAAGQHMLTRFVVNESMNHVKTWWGEQARRRACKRWHSAECTYSHIDADAQVHPGWLHWHASLSAVRWSVHVAAAQRQPAAPSISGGMSDYSCSWNRRRMPHLKSHLRVSGNFNVRFKFWKRSSSAPPSAAQPISSGVCRH